MNKLEKQIFTRLENEVFIKDGLLTTDFAAKKSAEITIDIVVKFHEWIRKSKDIIDKQNGSYLFNNNYYITEELFQIFINNHYESST